MGTRTEYWEGECGCGHNAHDVWRVAASMSGPEEFDSTCCEAGCLCGEPDICTGCFVAYDGECDCYDDEEDE